MSSGSINQVLRLLATSIKQKPSKFSIVSGNQSGGEYTTKSEETEQHLIKKNTNELTKF